MKCTINCNNEWFNQYSTILIHIYTSENGRKKDPITASIIITFFDNTLIKIKKAHIGKVPQFCRKFTNQCKICRELSVFIGKTMLKS